MCSDSVRVPLFDQTAPCRPLAAPNSSSSPPLAQQSTIPQGSPGCLLLSLPQAPALSPWVYQGSSAPPTEVGLLPPAQQHEFWRRKLGPGGFQLQVRAPRLRHKWGSESTVLLAANALNLPLRLFLKLALCSFAQAEAVSEDRETKSSPFLKRILSALGYVHRYCCLWMWLLKGKLACITMS